MSPPKKTGGDRIAYVYDGKQISEKRLGAKLSNLGPELGASVWLGEHPTKFMAAPEWKEPLIDLFGEDGFAFAVRAIGVVIPAYQDGRWVVFSGCKPHACNEEAALVAVDINSNRMVGVLWSNSGAPKMYGDPNGEIPNALAKILVGKL